MKLHIIEDKNDRVQLRDGIMLVASHLRFNATHLFIASNEWSSIEIDLCDDIPRNVLKYVIANNKCELIVNYDKEITKHQMQLLCELYPEKQGIITRTFIKGGDLHDVLS